MALTQIQSGMISEIPDGSVTTSKLVDLNITAAKLHTTAVTDKLGYTPLNKAGDTATGKIGLFSHNVSTGTQRRIRTYEHAYQHAQNTTVNLMYNTSSYTDVHFTLTLEGFHSGRSYQMWQGCFGGYGANFITTGGSGGFSLQNVGIDAGRAYLAISAGALTTTSSNFVAITIYGDSDITIVNGALY
jgi:hypothetical protein